MNTEAQIGVEDRLLVAVFCLGDASFGIDARQVQEVTRPGDITPVHHAPDCVVGIRNLRGRIVTVIDLRARLDLGRVTTAGDNRILIVESQGEILGLLVDSVADTISPRPSELLPPPTNLHGVHGRHLRAVCRSDGGLVALLNLDGLTRLDNDGPPGTGTSLGAPREAVLHA